MHFRRLLVAVALVATSLFGAVGGAPTAHAASTTYELVWVGGAIWSCTTQCTITGTSSPCLLAWGDTFPTAGSGLCTVNINATLTGNSCLSGGTATFTVTVVTSNGTTNFGTTVALQPAFGGLAWGQAAIGQPSLSAVITAGTVAPCFNPGEFGGTLTYKTP